MHEGSQIETCARGAGVRAWGLDSACERVHGLRASQNLPAASSHILFQACALRTSNSLLYVNHLVASFILPSPAAYQAYRRLSASHAIKK